MSHGTWEDFTDKYGFSDGGASEDRDFRARDILCRMLNDRDETKEAKIRFVPWDRPGMHNACLVIVFHNPEAWPDEELVKLWKEDKIEEFGELPEWINPSDEPIYDMDWFISEAYWEADHPPVKKRAVSKKKALLALVKIADEALGSDSNDEEHGALWEIRMELAKMAGYKGMVGNGKGAYGV